jgi:hypothetical protein
VALTWAHFSAAKASILGGARSPQYLTCAPSRTAALSANAGGTGSRGSDAQPTREKMIRSDGQRGLRRKHPIRSPRELPLG